MNTEGKIIQKQEELGEQTIVKIFLNSGLILTVKISKQTDKQIIGTDKFGKPVIITISDIKLMIPKGEKKC